jgi:lysophospholipase L1-like esterase
MATIYTFAFRTPASASGPVADAGITYLGTRFDIDSFVAGGGSTTDDALAALLRAQTRDDGATLLTESTTVGGGATDRRASVPVFFQKDQPTPPYLWNKTDGAGNPTGVVEYHDGSSAHVVGSTSLTVSRRARDMVDAGALSVTITDQGSLTLPGTGPLVTATQQNVFTVSGGTLVAGLPFRYNWTDVAVQSSYAVALSDRLDTSLRTTSTAVPLTVSFDFDGQIFAMRCFGGTAGTGTWRVYANEQVSADQAWTGQGDRFVMVDFGSRARRRVVLEFDTFGEFGGLAKVKTDSLTAPVVQSSKIAIIGDSYSMGQGSLGSGNSAARSYAAVLARVLGFANYKVFGHGGTGWVKTSTPGAAYSNRLADVIAYAPDVVIAQDSINDNGQSGVNAAKQAGLNTLAAGLPRARIVSVSPLAVASLSTYATLTADMAAAAASVNVPFVDYITAAPVFGTGSTGATTGNGNADYYQSGSQANHPSQAGHDFIGRWLASQIAPLIGVGV